MRRADGTYVTTGRERHPSYWTVDLRLSYVRHLVGQLDGTLTLDVLNALDNQDPIRVEEAHNPERSGGSRARDAGRGAQQTTRSSRSTGSRGCCSSHGATRWGWG